VEARTVRFGIEIPKALSLLAHHDPNAEVTGLNDVPRQHWPNVLVTHLAFQTMVGSGFLLIGLAFWFVWEDRRRRELSRLLTWALVLAAPLGFVALEAGWIVTEAGRQPWIIYQVMETRSAVTTVPNILATFIGFTLLYTGLGAALAVLLRRLGDNRRAQSAKSASVAAT
jgi:cytochrome d ubiquinol oxidase subunit I